MKEHAQVLGGAIGRKKCIITWNEKKCVTLKKPFVHGKVGLLPQSPPCCTAVFLQLLKTDKPNIETAFRTLQKARSYQLHLSNF